MHSVLHNSNVLLSSQLYYLGVISVHMFYFFFASVKWILLIEHVNNNSNCYYYLCDTFTFAECFTNIKTNIHHSVTYEK